MDEIPKLTPKQVEELCEIAERTARTYILSKVSPKKISVLNISIEIEGVKPITVNVEVEVILSPLIKNYDAKKLADEAIKKAFMSIENYLMKLVFVGTRQLTC